MKTPLTMKPVLFPLAAPTVFITPERERATLPQSVY